MQNFLYRLFIIVTIAPLPPPSQIPYLLYKNTFARRGCSWASCPGNCMTVHPIARSIMPRQNIWITSGSWWESQHVQATPNNLPLLYTKSGQNGNLWQANYDQTITKAEYLTKCGSADFSCVISWCSEFWKQVSKSTRMSNTVVWRDVENLDRLQKIWRKGNCEYNGGLSAFVKNSRIIYGVKTVTR